LLNSHDQDLTLDYLVEIRQQSALEKAEESEPKERTVTVYKLTEEIALIEAGIKVFEDIAAASSNN
jgi:hypothetical protein